MPMRGRITFDNEGGQLSAEIDANGNRTELHYDGLGRHLLTRFADNAEAWTLMDQRGQTVLRRHRSGHPSFSGCRRPGRANSLPDQRRGTHHKSAWLGYWTAWDPMDRHPVRCRWSLQHLGHWDHDRWALCFCARWSQSIPGRKDCSFSNAKSAGIAPRDDVVGRDEHAYTPEQAYLWDVRRSREMRWFALVGIIAAGCGYTLTPSDSDQIAQTRATHVVETCARSQSCAQRSDHNAKGYSQCVGPSVVLVGVSQLGNGVVSAVFRCDIGEGYLFRVVVHGSTGPAYEEVYQCQAGCPRVEDAFAPIA